MKHMFSQIGLMLALAAGVGALPGLASAHSWGGVGVFFGFPPVVLGGPVYAPPPVYDEPPPLDYSAAPPDYDAAPPGGYYPALPESGQQAPVGFTCYARPYECPLAHPRRIGRPCACAALDGGAIAGSVVR